MHLLHPCSPALYNNRTGTLSAPLCILRLDSLLEKQFPVTGYEVAPNLYQQASPRVRGLLHAVSENFLPHICQPSTDALPTQLHEKLRLVPTIHN